MFFFVLVIFAFNSFFPHMAVSSRNFNEELGGGEGLLFTGEGEESTLVFQPELKFAVNKSLRERYPPRVAGFSKNLNEAKQFTNAEFLKLSLVEKGQHIHDVAQSVIKAHGLENIYSPRIITCKNYKESTFIPQIAARHSSAKGMSQVINGTVDAVFDQTDFRFQTPGFEHIKKGSMFRKHMAKSMNAQIELGIGVLEVKRAESGVSRIKTLLGRYYGRNKVCNKDYANRVYSCAYCIKKAKKISQKCLNKAVGLRRGCV